MRIIASGFVFYGISMVLTQSLNGAGDTKTPTKINIICLWLFQIPLAYCLVHFTPLKASGALISLPITHTVLTLMAWFYFKRGRWKEITV